MHYKLGNFNFFIEDDYDAMSKRGAQILASQIYAKPDSTIGLATGSTPIGMYKELARIYKDGLVDFSEVSTFNLDEYYPISRENNQSYYYFMHSNFFNHVNISRNKIHIPNGESEEVEEECVAYENALRASGGLDIQLLGVGNNGHIAFNEPDSFFEPVTHVVTLAQNTIEANSRFFDSIDEVPHQAISMGIQSIMSAKKILLLVNGAGKAGIVKKMVFEKITPHVPASILQLHNNVDIVLTKDAATGIVS